MSYLSVSSPISGIAGKRNEFIQAYVNHFVCLANEIGFDYLLKLRKHRFHVNLCVLHFQWSAKYCGANEMSAQTVLLDLAIDSSRISDAVGQKDVIKLLEKGLLEYFPQLKLIFETSTSDGHLCVFSQNDTIFLHARFFNHGIVTINIEFFKKDDAEQPLVSFDVSTQHINSIHSNYIFYCRQFTFQRSFLPLRAKDTDSLSH